MSKQSNTLLQLFLSFLYLAYYRAIVTVRFKLFSWRKVKVTLQVNFSLILPHKIISESNGIWYNELKWQCWINLDFWLSLLESEICHGLIGLEVCPYSTLLNAQLTAAHWTIEQHNNEHVHYQSGTILYFTRTLAVHEEEEQKMYLHALHIF